ncbi:hypothetical protein [Aurantiacibacter sediminis]|uniref:UrcA family protein n=1 Tax=Aurantiacibacter sediminis TaxID=2793064 RepID=A0ABS0N490_9SPHN|nr:hypothetical protein [Aurantiacibacter sediminis]MBH5322805.1 hypothetical protein [Aurantiacibacter sediminis]
MLRQLLTLLAVFSGFTLAAEPVQAAQGAVVSVASASECMEAQPAVYASVEHSAVAQASAVVADKGCEQRAQILPAPSIMLQADRARE